MTERAERKNTRKKNRERVRVPEGILAETGRRVAERYVFGEFRESIPRSLNRELAAREIPEGFHKRSRQR